MTPTFKHVEDYIEFIAGYRTRDNSTNFFTVGSPPISLARYDIDVVSNLATQVLINGNAYTDKQAALASKIVAKYQRQLANLTPPVILPESLDSYRNGIRKIDRAQTMVIKDGAIIVKFPYNTSLISMLREHSKKGIGTATYNSTARTWSLGLTEYNVNWACTVGLNSGFEIDDELKALYAAILEAEQTEYAIKLVATESGFAITNAPTSLTEYIDEQLGGFGADNLLRLLDNAPVLGYTVDPEVERAGKELYDLSFVSVRSTTLKNTDEAWDKVLQYARDTNRLPVYVYSTGLPKPNTDEIVYLGKGVSVDTPIKLMVSTSALMIGSKKQAWVSNAEKHIFLE